jgi:5-formyltetrahydrofolate cyclo-ligase
VRSEELKRAKRAARDAIRAARDLLPAPDRARASARIAERVVGLPEVQRASTVMVFWSFGSEVDTAPLTAALNGDGKRVALPRIVQGDLEPRSYAPGDPVIETTFGAFEPSEGLAVDPSEIDAVIAPGLAFDRSGRRVGYGGGFYDRFFLRTRPDTVRVGIGFDLQLVDDDLPDGHFDLRIDIVVTESEIVRCRRDG